MCGIIGVISNKQDFVASHLLAALSRLEYRGYDSSGVAIINKAVFKVYREPGKLSNLQDKLRGVSMSSNIGVGHIRWSTHGVASEANAHPQYTNDVAIVHNGIIENHRLLRQELEALGAVFSSDTDTENIAHLLDFSLKNDQSIKEAAKAVLDKCEGAFAIAAIFSKMPNTILAIKRKAPLIVAKAITGDGQTNMMVGSDILAFASKEHVNIEAIYLEDDEFAIITSESISIYDRSGNEIKKQAQVVIMEDDPINKGDFKHFMEKEIFQQPVVSNQLLQYYNALDNLAKIESLDFQSINKIYFVACGTSYMAASIAKYWFEKYAKIAIEVDIASEFRYRHACIDPSALLACISQSGETTDTLAALECYKTQAKKTLAIVNVERSSIANACDVVLPIKAGYEVGVASTKALTNQLMLLATLVIKAAKNRGHFTVQQEQAMMQIIFDIPANMNNVLAKSKELRQVAQELGIAKSILVIGRGTNYPLAMEGALKIKELSYIHAEGLAAGELKHGPIALIDEETPVIALVPFDECFIKTVSNIAEIKARNGFVIAITDQRGLLDLEDLVDIVITLPEVHEIAMPMLYAVALQLIAYHIADILEKDVDQPRNLAKSVTVE